MKILITGFPGTGKSSVAKELRRRGRAAYDIEAMSGYARVEDRKTGQPIEMPSPLPPGWFSDVGINRWDINKVSELLSRHEDVFICGLGGNQDQLYGSFDQIFVLIADDTILEQRLRSRLTSDFGKDRDSLADILRLHKGFEAELVSRGAVAIDVRQAVPEVVSTILSPAFNGRP